ncbi:MAG: efflux RND transporter permease subunit [Myxococcota bacterium]
MSPAGFAVRQPVFVNLVAISMAVVGGLIFYTMDRESLPTVPTGWGGVETVYAGASPEEIERLITMPVENAVAQLDDIEEIWSESREGISWVYFKLNPGVTNVPQAIIEVANEVNRVDDLPLDAERPHVHEFKVDRPTLWVAVRGDVSESIVRRIGRDLADKIERLPDVAGTWRQGVRDRELRVDVDPDRLAAYRLPLTAVTEALRQRGANVPAGTTDNARGDVHLIRGMTRVDTVDEIERVVVRPSPRGGSVRVRDVADVQDTFAPGALSSRMNGEPAIVITVKKDEQGDSLRISESVHRVIDELAPSLPKGVTVEVFGDVAHSVNRSLTLLYANAAAGLILVLALLWFFIGARNATMAALGLPVSLAGAIAAMDAMGITINMVSLLALILCLGIIVDDAIIIIENIYRHMEEGLSRRKAAIVGTREVFWPVVSSTLTTWAAFLPMLLMTGTLGKFFAIIPKVVVASLAASLIEAMFVLPSHMADFGKLERRRQDGVPETRAQRIGRRVLLAYERTLRGAIQHRRVVVGVAYALCIGLVTGIYTTKDTVLFNEGDVDMFDVRVRLPTETSKEDTEAFLSQMEAQILVLENPIIDDTLAVRGMVRTPKGTERGDHTGTISVFLAPVQYRDSGRAGEDALSQVDALFKDLVGPTSLDVVAIRQGPSGDPPITVRVVGDDYDRLIGLAEQVLVEIRNLPGTRNERHDFQLGKEELKVTVDEQRAALHDLTATEVTAWLRSAFGATAAATLQMNQEEIDIVVQLDEKAQRDAATIATLRMITDSGADLQLQEVAEVIPGRGPGVIRRFERKQVVTVRANIDSNVTNMGEANRRLQRRLAPLLAANPDVEFKLAGQFEEAQESLDSLFQAFVVAILLIYTILATQFQSFSQPLVVITAVPLSLIGVSIGFFLDGRPISLIALVGVVGLAGIVVNDSLVLVEFINTRRRGGLSLDEAIVEAGKLRVRPILLTSVTTIAGLIPVALAMSSLPFLAPMAQVVVWGLAFSTALTLFIVPCLYRVDVDVSARLSSTLAPVTQWLTDPGVAVVDDGPDEHESQAAPRFPDPAKEG